MPSGEEVGYAKTMTAIHTGASHVINAKGEKEACMTPNTRASVAVKAKRAAKGHQNLAIRAACTFLTACITALTMLVGVDRMHKIPTLFFQITSAASLYIQWQTGKPSMFLLRATCSFALAVITLHNACCGRTWLWESCSTKAWDGELRIMRILTCLMVLRSFLNGVSLCLQFRFPHIMFAGHGNAQLFWRGVIQLTGTPIGITRVICQAELVRGHSTEPEYLDLEMVTNCVIFFLLIPISGNSLISQWYLTAKGLTGNATSDAYERLVNPNIDCPKLRVQVRIIKAWGLRNADWNGKSDPYCTCMVIGRSASSWHTRTIDDTVEPTWDEVQELKTYRKNDSLLLRIYDEDVKVTCGGVVLYNKADDALGEAIVNGSAFEDSGFFQGDLPLAKTGNKEGQDAFLQVQIQLLDADGKPTRNSLQAVVDEDTTNLDDLHGQVKDAVSDTVDLVTDAVGLTVINEEEDVSKTCTEGDIDWLAENFASLGSGKASGPKSITSS